jgi:hypothetical protein
MYRSVIFTVAGMLSAATAVYATPPASNTTAKAVDPRDQMVCRRFVRTGSLVDGYRVCKTRRDWDRDAENVRALSSSDSCRNEANGGQC